ncbi:transcriptional regulator, AraC family [Paenibacillus curdlanolyticus YK9]|uniref:Transcriptional regulator, AraC family n=1 Tax=Paenibacillus curdlanolyticus YK9 TaxID=717606 RepID=E0I7R4_9BACL|nr:AraC family transcriptional regulator [Paenibacillus curdlanolyticus]EFM11219.1 transcriptional regulator, AraC family [Paenibacillus curdlanolyticus YK9]
MKIDTVGVNHHPNYRHALVYNSADVLDWDEAHHSRYKLVLVLDGTGLISCGAHVYPLIAPAFYCLNELDELKCISGGHLTVCSLFFHPGLINAKFELGGEYPPSEALLSPPEWSLSDQQDQWCLEPFIERSDAYSGCIPTDSATARYALSIMEAIGEQLASQPDYHWPCRSRTYLLELLYLTSRKYRQADSFPEQLRAAEIQLEGSTEVKERIDAVIRYLHTRYAEKIRIDQLARIFHTNKTTLNQQFKRYTGTTVMAYLNQVRMQTAGAMLRNTLLPKDEIMLRIGIRDAAHFLRHFRKFAGYTPTEYRNRFCWMLQS